AARIAASEPRDDAEIVVQGGLRATVDPALARTLLENLFGNVWKFTDRTPRPRIEVGAEEVDGARALFVRDNGAGFDMKYVARLFTPFQRLHSTREFPGTGIGLATSQRIIERHGGRMWARGKVGAGATFYFTLDAPPGLRS